MRIASDLDSTVINIADYDPQGPGTKGGWLWRHNQEYGHEKKMVHDEILDWATDKYAAPSCGLNIYKYLSDPDFYDYAPPLPGAVETLTDLIACGDEVWFVTSGIHQGKYRWVARHGLTGLADGGVKAKNIITIDEKNLLVPIFDVLIDDRAETCVAWEQAGGVAILVDMPWNWWCVDVRRRARSWDEIRKFIEEMRRG